MNIIGQYLPERGDVLEIGCGFGLSALYFSAFHPNRVIHGYDLDKKRVRTAAAAAKDLGQTNTHFTSGDAANLTLERSFDAAYAIDVIHHLPREGLAKFLEGIFDRLQPGGRFIIKDVDNAPAYKRWFSWVTDRAMVGLSEPIYYWSVEELCSALRNAGFTVFVHPMPDILPYPHVFYICEK
jgi:SAM-dependent methyltransferase